MSAVKFWPINTKQYFFTFLMICLFHGWCFANDCISSQVKRNTIIVNGASGELGGATARLLAHDYNLILTGRDIAKLKKLQEELTIANRGHYDICCFDFISKASRDSFESYLNQSQQPITGLVLIVPRPKFDGTSLMQDEKIWLEVFQSTFTGPLEALKAVLPHLSNPSKIVVIAGTTSVQLQSDYGASCVIRRMWTTYTKALSHQIGSQGISVNALSPGVVLTNFHQERIQKKSDETGLSYDEQMEKEVANIPLRRHAKPQEVAQTIKFLLSEQSDFIHGINLILDGGETLSY
ncbi:MAG: SDR family NAD(P)-dependent oxidoreductase [Parachlamydiaceae bacterium]